MGINGWADRPTLVKTEQARDALHLISAADNSDYRNIFIILELYVIMAVEY